MGASIMGKGPRAWRFAMKGSLHTMELYTRAGRIPASLDEAMQAADDQYGSEWVELYDGVEGAIRAETVA